MKYKFKSLFNRDKEYTIETDEPLDLYDDFALSIKKVDKNSKSFSSENIDCVLKYGKHNQLGLKTIELERENFSGYLMMVETYKLRNAVSMGEPLEMVKNEVPYEFKGVTLNNANNELKLAFNKYVEDNKLMDVLFHCFLRGVAYGKNKG
jgi:hypothetical protein